MEVVLGVGKMVEVVEVPGDPT
jgi:hypothetical protein